MTSETTAPPPHPVVAITIDGDTITVNGAPIEHDGTQPLHQAAIHAVARQVAQPLNRPVRAIATDDTGRTALVVHPDGHASDHETLPAPELTEAAQETPRYGDPATVPQPATAAAEEPAMDHFERLLVEPAGPTGAAPQDSRGIPAPVQGLGFASPPSPAEGQSPADTRAARRADAEDGGGRGRSFLTHHEDIEPAQTGVRGFLTRIGLRSGPNEAEQAERADIRAISRHWPGPRTIAIVNAKGGAGKTPTTVLLSALFARQGGSGVLAWDNNETRGTLGWRTEQGPHEGHVLGLLPHTERLMQPTARAADLAAFVHHQVDDKFDVLRSNPLLLPHQQRLTAEDFDAVHLVASKYFRLIFIDSGNDETAPHWLQMIDHADQLVVATTTRPDHAEAGRLLLEALGDRDAHSSGLADAAVVVVSQADREEASAATIAAGYDGLVRQAVTIPYDRALRAPWLRFKSLQPATQRAYLRAAAAVSDGL
jgi:MinD-like ATPase involved in chromosome partitioning or flagellar assembly